jgi:hypothetical protein
MKIVGISQDESYSSTRRYLVECTEDELMKAAGHAYPSELRSVERKLFDDRGHLRIGVVLKVGAAFDYLRKLRENDQSCRGAAKMLVAMADMIDGAMPTTIVPPDDEPSQES